MIFIHYLGTSGENSTCLIILHSLYRLSRGTRTNIDLSFPLSPLSPPLSLPPSSPSPTPHPPLSEPLVRIVYPEEPELTLTHQAPERLELSCEISQADAQVCWFRDGLEVEEGPQLVLEASGARRTLVIPRTTEADSGEYACDTEHDSVTFLVTVTGEGLSSVL